MRIKTILIFILNFFAAATGQKLTIKYIATRLTKEAFLSLILKLAMEPFLSAKASWGHTDLILGTLVVCACAGASFYAYRSYALYQKNLRVEERFNPNPSGLGSKWESTLAPQDSISPVEVSGYPRYSSLGSGRYVATLDHDGDFYYNPLGWGISKLGQFFRFKKNVASVGTQTTDLPGGVSVETQTIALPTNVSVGTQTTVLDAFGGPAETPAMSPDIETLTTVTHWLQSALSTVGTYYSNTWNLFGDTNRIYSEHTPFICALSNYHSSVIQYDTLLHGSLSTLIRCANTPGIGTSLNLLTIDVQEAARGVSGNLIKVFKSIQSDAVLADSYHHDSVILHPLLHSCSITSRDIKVDESHLIRDIAELKNRWTPHMIPQNTLVVNGEPDTTRELSEAFKALNEHETSVDITYRNSICNIDLFIESREDINRGDYSNLLVKQYLNRTFSEDHDFLLLGNQSLSFSQCVNKFYDVL